MWGMAGSAIVSGTVDIEYFYMCSRAEIAVLVACIAAVTSSEDGNTGMQAREAKKAGGKTSPFSPIPQNHQRR